MKDAQIKDFFMLTPDEFEVNDAWIIIRINDEFLYVKEEPYDMFVLLDAASTYVLGFVFSEVVNEAPVEKDVEDLFRKAWNTKSQWAKKLIITENSLTNDLFIKHAEKNGIKFDTIPESDLLHIIGPLKESFVKDLIGRPL